MRKNLIKFLSIILSSVSILNTSFNSFAYELDADDNSIEQIEYQNSENENFSNTSNVFAEISNIYNITIPKTIVLNGQEKKASYYVKVEGDIAGYQVLNVVPDDFFYLYSINKDGAITSVYQDKTSWTYDEFNVLAEGTVLADFITAGKWKGTFNFNIFIDEERVAGDIILPDSLKDYKLVISKIEDLPGLYDIDGNLLVKYSTLETDLGLNEEIPNSTFSSVYPSNLSTSLGDIINTDYPEGVFLSLPENVDTIENNAFTNTNIKYVYLPESVQEIGDDVFPEDTICVNLPRKVKHIGHINKNIPIYQKGYPVKELEIDFEDIKNMKEDDVLTLYKGYRYKIEALYNFNDDVTGQSTIKSSNENIVQYNPVYFLDAINTGTCFISGTYNTPSGKANAQIKLKVISDKNYTKHKHIKGETKKENIIDGTCSEKGSYDLVTYCKACGKKIEVKKIETDFNHNWTLSVNTPATCEADSTEAYICTRCSETKVTHNNKATGHIIKSSKVVNPTCTTQGYTTYVCSKCGQSYNDNFKPSLGHSYKSNGKCSRCNDFNVSALAPGIYTVSNNNYTLKTSWATLIKNGTFSVDKNGLLKLKGVNITTATSPNASALGTNTFLVVDKSVKQITESALLRTEIGGIFIPETVTVFQPSRGMNTLNKIMLSDKNKNFKVKDNILYSYDLKTLILAPKGTATAFTVPNTVERIKQYAFERSKYTSIKIPEGVKYIESCAFRWMPNVKTFYIPDSVTNLEGVFAQNYANTQYILNSTNPKYTLNDGVIYSKDMKTILSCPAGRTKELNIPSTVTKIGNNLCDGCKLIPKITMTNNITYIGWGAFRDCTKITSITLPNKITIIENNTFTNVPLKNITIPASVKTINVQNFQKATKVTFADTSHKWKMTLYSGGTAWSSVPKSAFAVTNATTNASYFKNGPWYIWTKQ